MAENARIMESYALPIFRLGVIPVLGEWFTLPYVTSRRLKTSRYGLQTYTQEQIPAI
jgi:hypothetical protein